MKVLIGCEFSGVVRREFRLLGHDAWSCDLLPSDDNDVHHIQGDVLEVLDNGWDLAIFHPPCTNLAISGARWFKYKQKEQKEALEFVKLLLSTGIPKVALENPISIISTHIRKLDQIIQPWQFGHGEVKSTCLWLSNLPKLIPTNIVQGRETKILNMAPTHDRGRKRSITYTGIAKAMAEQWG